MKKIKQIFISNVLECYYHSYCGLSKKEKNFWISYDHKEANRALFYGADNKVVVTSFPIHVKNFQNVKKMMKWKNVFNLYPDKPGYSISKDIMQNKNFQQEIVQIIKDNQGVDLIPYRTTDEFIDLVEYLKSLKLNFQTPETVNKDFIFIQNYINTKRGFRHLWYKAVNNKLIHKIHPSEGFIARDKDEAIEAGWWFKSQKRSFALKYSKGVQGIGIIFCRQETLPSIKEVFIKKMQDIMSDKIWDEPVIVVEEFIDVDTNVLNGSPNVELMVDRNGKVKFLYACEQVLASDRKTFTGIYIHKSHYKNNYLLTAKKAGILWGKELSRLGYRGNFDIDLVISKDKKLIAVESNLRRTGGTHVFEAAKALFGSRFYEKKCVIGEDIDIKSGKVSFEKIEQLLKNEIFDPKRGEGVIICNADLLDVGKLNVILIANSESKIQKIRKKVYMIAGKLGVE